MPKAPALRALLLFAGAAAISGITILKGIQPNDEGLMLGAAARIADGQVPYSDFWWYYPPGQAYLLGGLWELFGNSLLTWRILRVATDATVALLVYYLARRRAPEPAALAAFLAAALAMAYPTGPHPVPPALAMALASLLLFEKRPAAAGALAGLCAFWRLELAGYLLIGILIAYAAARNEERGTRNEVRFALSATLVGAALYVPVVLSASISRSFELLVRWPLQEFQKQQGLPFPLDYDGPLNTDSIGGFFGDSFENLLEFYLPLTLLAGFVAVLIGLGLRFRRERAEGIALAVFAVGCMHYMLVRTDTFHTAPLAVCFSVLAAWLWAERHEPARWGGRRVAAVPAVVAALAFAYLLGEGLDRRWLELRHDTVALHLDVADGVRVPEDEREQIEPAVGYVREHVPPGEPIYVIGRRADWTTSGNPLFYVLADRPNPTRYDIAQPGIVTTAEGQREIVADLEEAQPKVVVRWTDPVTTVSEPNRAGEPTGVRILDDFLAANYEPAESFGYYSMLLPR